MPENIPDAGRQAACADELGSIAARLAQIKPLQDRFDSLKKEITGWYADAPADQPGRIEGQQYVVEIGPRGMVREILPAGKRKLQKRLGAKGFFEVCSVPLAVLDRLIPEAEQGEYVTSSQSGPRRIKTVCRFLEAA